MEGETQYVTTGQVSTFKKIFGGLLWSLFHINLGFGHGSKGLTYICFELFCCSKTWAPQISTWLGYLWSNPRMLMKKRRMVKTKKRKKTKTKKSFLHPLNRHHSVHLLHLCGKIYFPHTKIPRRIIFGAKTLHFSIFLPLSASPSLPLTVKCISWLDTVSQRWLKKIPRGIMFGIKTLHI